MEDSIELVQEHPPDSIDEFLELGLVKDGIYKRTEFAIENVFDICAILNADLRLGVPGNDEEIFGHMQARGILTRNMRQNPKSDERIPQYRCASIREDRRSPRLCSPEGASPRFPGVPPRDRRIPGLDPGWKWRARAVTCCRWHGGGQNAPDLSNSSSPQSLLHPIQLPAVPRKRENRTTARLSRWSRCERHICKILDG